MTRTLLPLLVFTSAFAASLRAQNAPAVPTLTSIAFFKARERADSLYRSRQFPAAESLYSALARSAPRDGLLHLRLGTVRELSGMLSEAVPAYVSAFRLDGGVRAEVAYNIAQLEARLGHKDVALAWIDSALANRMRNRNRMQRDSSFRGFDTDPRFRRQAGMLPAGKVSRTEGWRADIALFVDEAQRLHVSLARPAFSPAFVAAAEKLTRDVPSLTDAQILAGIQRLAAMLGDGHSYIAPRLPSAPVQFYAFDDGLFVVKGAGAGASLVGQQVMRIGRVTADSALSFLRSNVPRDNELTPLWLGMLALSSPAAVSAYGLSDDSERLRLEVRDAAGVVRTVSLSADTILFARTLLPPSATTSPAPLWLQRVATAHWLTPLPEMSAVYAQYNQVSNDRTETVAQFADKVTLALRDNNATNLIVDVRHNNGGNRALNAPLLAAMAAFKRAAPANRVFIIMGRGTFSAAQIFISQAEGLVNPIFVGEPSSSRPNFVGEETGVELPYSHAFGSVSNKYHQGTVYDDERPFIAPHIPVVVRAADYFANRDAALDALAQLLRHPTTP